MSPRSRVARTLGAPVEIGRVTALFRYPVKSMAGESVDVADLGWHGLDGDRRVAFRRADDRSGFPWLTATRLPELLLFAPERRDTSAAGLPTHVRTPEGRELTLFGEELAAEIERRHGSPVEATHLNRGIFDEASVSVITTATVNEIGTLAAVRPDVRRFRPNILIGTLEPVPFEEDGWVGGVLSFGDTADAASVGIVNYDERCSMVNFDPDSAQPAAEVLKAIVRERGNKAGVYATVLRRGRIAVGEPVRFQSSAAGGARR